MAKYLIVVILLIGHMNQSIAQAKLVSPETTNDTKNLEENNNMIELLGNIKTSQAAIDSILANPNLFNPVVTYLLSNTLLEQGKKNEAMFWFFLSQVRARVDANMCKDTTAKEAVSILNMTYGPAINKVAFSNIDSLAVVVSNVVAYAKANDELYNKQWINLHGMEAMINSLENKSAQSDQSEPKEKWAEIKTTTIENYYADFIKYVVKGNKE